MYIYRRRDPAGLDGAAWEPPPARADGDPASEHRAGPLARTLVGIGIILLVAVLIAVIALAL